LAAEQVSAGGSDESLLADVRAGDMQAFEVLVRRHRGAAMAAARAMVDPVTAEDVVADSFERLLVAVRRGGGPRDVVRPYLLRAVRNRAVDVFRRRETPTELDDRCDALTEPQSLVEDRLLVRAAFDALPERWQAVLWMSLVEECDRHEIARHLGIPPGAVSQLLVRAKEGLRQAYLAQYASSAEPSCREVSGMLPPYVRGRASRRETAKVETHLADCGRCPGVIAQLRAINHGLGIALGAAVLGKLALDAYQAPVAAARSVAGSLPPVKAVVAGSLAVVGAVAVAVVATSLAGAPPAAGPAQGVVTSRVGAPTASVSPSSSSASSTPRTSSATPEPPRHSAVPDKPPPVTRDPESTPRATRSRVTPTPTSAPTSGPTSAPTSSPAPSVTSTPVPAAPVSVGTPIALPRADEAFPVHVTLPVTAPAGTAVTATVTVKGMSAFQVHVDRSYGAWSCVAAPANVDGLSCRLTATAATNDLGLDLSYTGAPVLRAEIGVEGAPPDPLTGIATLPLPPLPR
jgi:RNA polymerase sigma factor (sigma-70 family)